MVINLNWGNIKFDYEYLLNLKNILISSKKDVILNFASIYYEEAGFPAFCQEIVELMKADNIQITIAPQLPYNEYMILNEKCDFAIDSYPFGGYNRIIDMLFCGKPVVALEGDKLIIAWPQHY